MIEKKYPEAKTISEIRDVINLKWSREDCNKLYQEKWLPVAEYQKLERQLEAKTQELNLTNVAMELKEQNYKILEGKNEELVEALKNVNENCKYKKGIKETQKILKEFAQWIHTYVITDEDVGDYLDEHEKIVSWLERLRVALQQKPEVKKK